jgi:hypothetical protein
VSDDDDKKKLAEQIAQLGDHQQGLMADAIRQVLRTFADGVAQFARHYEHDAWVREWVSLVNLAVADLRAAEERVQIQPLAPHGEVPS